MIVTERLVLRLPEPRDRGALVGMFTDQEVMADLFPGLDEAAAEAVLTKHDGFRHEGLGFLTVERREDGAVVGFCGLKRGEKHSPIADRVEAGWIVDKPWWRHGYAGEAMAAILDDAWPRIDADRIYAITAALNLKSQGLMSRLGMQRLADGDYDSATFPEGHRLRPTVTFAIERPAA
ncbi:GNAT family N-acetyltransferase [Sphingomonas sp. G-3-2-10]|uniref:GNAT family N-acetyltransferase n=1 Tax=Sphingomonas sp. G-3-2-10 TaxID=2728838 RepID=UPI00146CF5C2|nr:GNAT family N-acetyltransferase [Sphingomonas sp. G-3-2-10]NML05155.1 GNAT family N-acetyltransferase [Sphingomonas sp. G-3-2-10]